MHGTDFTLSGLNHVLYLISTGVNGPLRHSRYTLQQSRPKTFCSEDRVGERDSFNHTHSHLPQKEEIEKEGTSSSGLISSSFSLFFFFDA